MRIELDCRNMTDKDTLHTYVADRLQLPDYYGRNLDALYDLLTENADSMSLVITNTSSICPELRPYFHAFLETLREASGSHPDLTVRIAGSL